MTLRSETEIVRRTAAGKPPSAAELRENKRHLHIARRQAEMAQKDWEDAVAKEEAK